MADIYRTPIVGLEIREKLEVKQTESLERMLETTFNSIDRETVHASELIFGLNALAHFLANGGEVQTVTDSFASRFGWMEEAAQIIHSTVINSRPHILPALEDTNPFFMGPDVQANFHRELFARIMPANTSEPKIFCDGVALGQISLDLRDLAAK
jgi:hypothetical protein